VNGRQPGEVGNLLLAHRERKCVAVKFAALLAAQHHVNDQSSDSFLGGTLPEVYKPLGGVTMLCRH